MSISFLDPDLQNRFETKGYVTSPLLDEARLERLRLIHNDLAPAVGIGFHTTICGDSIGRKVVVDSILRAEVGNLVLSRLKDHRLVFGNFAIRYPGPESEIILHQDWAFVDEIEHVSIGVWCPLVDLELDGGCLYVLEESHRHIETHRGSGEPSLPNYSEAYPQLISEQVLELRNTPVPMKAGEALFFDHRLVYSSPPILSTEDQPALLFGAVPVAAELLHFYRRASDRVEVYPIPDSFLLEQEFGLAPTGTPVRTQSPVSRCSFPLHNPARPPTKQERPTAEELD